MPVNTKLAFIETFLAFIVETGNFAAYFFQNLNLLTKLTQRKLTSVPMTSVTAKAIFIPATMLLSSLSFTHVYDEDFGKKQKESLKKNYVHSISGWTFVYQNGVAPKSGVKTSIERFDEKGNRTEDVFFNEKG